MIGKENTNKPTDYIYIKIFVLIKREVFSGGSHENDFLFLLSQAVEI